MPLDQLSPDSAAALGAVQRSGSDLRAGTARTQALLSQESAEMAPVQKEADAALASPKPAAPSLQAAPEAPKFQEQMAKNGNEFIRMSTLLAGMVGAFTRSHVTTALNAFGAMNKGFAQGQMDAANRGFEEWKASSDEVKSNNDALLKEYKNALDDRRATVDELSARMGLIATKYKDPLMEQAAINQNIGMMAQVYEHLYQFNQNYGLNKEKIEAAIDAKKTALREQMEASGLDPTTQAGREALQKLPPGVAKKTVDLYYVLNPDKKKSDLTSEGQEWATVDYILTGHIPALGMGGKDERVAIINEAPKVAAKYGLTMGEAMSLPAERKADAGALQRAVAWAVGVDRSADIVDRQLEIAKPYAAELGLTEVQFINKRLVAGETEFGSPEANAYAQAMLTAATEFGRMLTGPLSAGMLAEGAAERANSRLNTGLTTGQFNEVEKLFHTEISSIKQASKDQIAGVKKRLHTIGNAKMPEDLPDPKGYTEGDTITDGGNDFTLKGGKWQRP